MLDHKWKGYTEAKHTLVSTNSMSDGLSKWLVDPSSQKSTAKMTKEYKTAITNNKLFSNIIGCSHYIHSVISVNGLSYVKASTLS